jgi:MoxR-like ATPase
MVKAEPEYRPVLVLTSNSEKNLAEAFLRRCVFYYIPFPDDERLERIVRRRLGAALDDSLLKSALGLVKRLRETTLGLLKTPSTGEMLAWMQDLAAKPARENKRLVERSLCALIKTREDREKARPEVENWVQELKL